MTGLKGDMPRKRLYSSSTHTLSITLSAMPSFSSFSPTCAWRVLQTGGYGWGVNQGQRVLLRE